MKRIYYCAIYLFAVSGCQKELSLEQTDLNSIKAEAFQRTIVEKKFQLKSFYSDTPVDYVETDTVVKQETNLWWYVSGYLKDDGNVFSSNKKNLSITQNALKIPGITDAVLNRNYTIGSDKDGVFMIFLDNEYKPLTYRVFASGPDYFILSVKWKYGATLYSKFEVIPI